MYGPVVNDTEEYKESDLEVLEIAIRTFFPLPTLHTWDWGIDSLEGRKEEP